MGERLTRYLTVPEFNASPAWTTAVPSNGWTGTVHRAKAGPVVTVGIQVVKATWGLGDLILATTVPTGWRPIGLFINWGGNAAGNNAARGWYIDPATGTIGAAEAGTGSIYGFVTYLVP